MRSGVHERDTRRLTSGEEEIVFNDAFLPCQRIPKGSVW